jgi:hypothetical protein
MRPFHVPTGAVVVALAAPTHTLSSAAATSEQMTPIWLGDATIGARLKQPSFNGKVGVGVEQGLGRQYTPTGPGSLRVLGAL